MSRYAYADPPYIGQAVKHYAAEAAADGRVASEVDHPALIARLCDEFPDGWALSMSAAMYSLKPIIAAAPDDARLGAWVKPFASFKPGVNPGYAWEPVLFRTTRKRDRAELTVRDWCAVPITLQRGVSGAKPEAFCRWIFDLLGMTRDDEFVDLYPGSGAVARAWERWRRETSLQLEVA